MDGEETPATDAPSQSIVAQGENIAATLLHDADKDVLTVLGHAHNLLSAMATDVTDARKSLEASIIAFVKHLG